MNKEVIGNFLRMLRNESGLTQERLSSAFGYIYSDATISKWERGESIPNIDDLKILAKYFNVSVDEILNGTRYEEVDLEKEYCDCDDELIEVRFKELLVKMVGEGLSLAEDKEFDYLARNFYKIFMPAVECKDKNTYGYSLLETCAWVDDIECCAPDCLPGGLSDIKFEIYKQTALMHNSTIEQKFWEANKKFVFISRQNIWTDINNVIDDDENELKKRLNTLDDYEKDILLATLQKINVVNTLAIGSPRGKELYEKKYGHQYDEEQLTKRAIKLLIECGAKLNKTLLGYWQVEAWEHTIIDKLEDIHKKYKTRLLVPVYEDGIFHYYTVDNTKNNRAKLGKKYDNEAFNESDYLELEKRLYAGEKTILKPYKDWVCGSNEWWAFLHARMQILNMSLEVYNESRNTEMTEELLENLDCLNLNTIREKYFPSEYKGQYVDDAQTMDFEELKKKYYIKEIPNE